MNKTPITLSKQGSLNSAFCTPVVFNLKSLLSLLKFDDNINCIWDKSILLDMGTRQHKHVPTFPKLTSHRLIELLFKLQLYCNFW